LVPRVGQVVVKQLNIGVMKVKSYNLSCARKPEEKVMFRYLMQTLVWAKEKTGKPSAEIISVILHKGKDELHRANYH